MVPRNPSQGLPDTQPVRPAHRLLLRLLDARAAPVAVRPARFCLQPQDPSQGPLTPEPVQNGQRDICGYWTRELLKVGPASFCLKS